MCLSVGINFVYSFSELSYFAFTMSTINAENLLIDLNDVEFVTLEEAGGGGDGSLPDASEDGGGGAEGQPPDATEDEALPEHSFVKKVVVGKTGKMKGQTRVTYTLIIGPHSFRNRGSGYKEIFYFSCTSCEKLKKTTNALANCILGETKEDD